MTREAGVGRRSCSTALDDARAAQSAIGKHTLVGPLDDVPSAGGVVQRRSATDASAGEPAAVKAAAAHGTAGTAGALPHLSRIQELFGRHDVSGIRAHVGGSAAEAAAAMGAQAYATGDHVAFASAPDLHTAAHEAAHVVQQAGGVQLAGGVGAAGDLYEQHANAVADLVVQGASAEALLDVHAGTGGAPSVDGAPVQRYTTVPGSRYSIGSSGLAFASQDLERSQFGWRFRKTEMTKPEDGEAEQLNQAQTTFSKTPKLGFHPSREPELVDRPALHVSAQGRMAIEATGQAKMFYADKETVDDGNAGLKASGSVVRLGVQGQSITVPAHPEDEDATETRTISMVKPVKPDGEGKPGLEVIVQREIAECNSFVKFILGTSDRARVALIGTGLDQREVRAPAEQEPVHAISRETLSDVTDPGTLTDNIKATPVEPGETGLIEQRLLDSRNARKHAPAPELGINEHALPRPGEAYVTHSLKEDLLEPTATFEGNHEYLDAINELRATGSDIDIMRTELSAKIKAMKGTWAYHYAGVVARNGDDTVTFENYNRAQEVKWETQRVFDELFLSFEDFREAVAGTGEKIEAGNPEQRKKFIELARAKGEALSEETRAAIAEAQASIALTDMPKAELIYFHMYGPEDQSFHAQFQGSMANPVTLVTRNSVELQCGFYKQENAQRAVNLSAAIAENSGNSNIDPQLVGARADVALEQVKHDSALDLATTLAALSAATAASVEGFAALRSAIYARIRTALKVVRKDAKDVDDGALLAEIERLEWWAKLKPFAGTEQSALAFLHGLVGRVANADLR